MDRTAHDTRAASATAPRDGGAPGLVALLDQLTRRTGSTSTSVGDGRDLHGVPWADQDPYVLRLLVGTARAYLELDVEHQRLEHERRGLEHLATHDVLTDLPNRTLVLDRLEHALASAARSGSAVAVLFIDVDGFKQINDTLGHAYGDIVLAEIAARLRLATRDGDTVGRLSGDEFVMVCENLPRTRRQVVEVVRRLARRITDTLSPPDPDGTSELAVSVSVGAAVSADDQDAATLLRAADAAMYESKRSGGGRLTVAAAGSRLQLVRAPTGHGRRPLEREDGR